MQVISDHVFSSLRRHALVHIHYTHPHHLLAWFPRNLC